jgi:hypothetical protein
MTTLQKEYNCYRRHLDEFIKTHPDQYVLIKDAKVVDFFPSYREALKHGLKHFGNVPFFIKAIEKKEEVCIFFRDL